MINNINSRKELLGTFLYLWKKLELPLTDDEALNNAASLTDEHLREFITKLEKLDEIEQEIEERAKRANPQKYEQIVAQYEKKAAENQDMLDQRLLSEDLISADEDDKFDKEMIEEVNKYAATLEEKLAGVEEEVEKLRLQELKEENSL